MDFSAGLPNRRTKGQGRTDAPFSADLQLIQDTNPLKPKQTAAQSTYLLTHRDCGRSLSDTAAETEWRTVCNNAGRWCGHPPPRSAGPVQRGASCGS